MTPLLLANENFPAPSIRTLRAAGLDVMAVAEFGRGMDDRDVFALARTQSRWLLTFDTDYAELVFRRRLPPPPAVLLLREPHYSPSEPAEWILPLVASAADVDGWLTRSRLRRRPLLPAAPQSTGKR